MKAVSCVDLEKRNSIICRLWNTFQLAENWYARHSTVISPCVVPNTHACLWNQSSSSMAIASRLGAPRTDLWHRRPIKHAVRSSSQTHDAGFPLPVVANTQTHTLLSTRSFHNSTIPISANCLMNKYLLIKYFIWQY